MGINEIIAAYNAAKARESAAKKEKELAAKLIIEYAKTADFFETDVYAVILDKRTREGLNTSALYEDFPDIKKDYGTKTTYTVITAKEKTAAARKSA